MDTTIQALHPSNNLLITGVPRSGTTLATALVDGMEDAFALSEPDSEVGLLEQSASPTDLVKRLAQQHAEIRLAVQQGEPVMDKRRADGTAVTDYFLRRAAAVERTATQVPVCRSGLSEHFLLATKHNALYTSVLPEIVQSGHFSVLALVRNPLHSILSWQDLPIPVARGRLPAGERFWPELESIALGSAPLLDKQVAFIELFFSRFLDAGPAITLVRYEDMAASPGHLAGLLQRRQIRPVPLKQRTRELGKASDLETRIAERIFKLAPSAGKVYPQLMA